MRRQFWFGMSTGVAMTVGLTIIGYAVKHPSSVERALGSLRHMTANCGNPARLLIQSETDETFPSADELTCLKPDGNLELPEEPQPIVEATPVPEAIPNAHLEVIQVTPTIPEPVATTPPLLPTGPDVPVHIDTTQPVSIAPPTQVTVVVHRLDDDILPGRLMPTCADEIEEAHAVMPHAEDTLADAAGHFLELWCQLFDLNVEVDVRMPGLSWFSSETDDAKGTGSKAAHSGHDVDDEMDCTEVDVSTTSTAEPPCDEHEHNCREMIYCPGTGRSYSPEAPRAKTPAHNRKSKKADADSFEESEEAPKPRRNRSNIDTMEFRPSDARPEEFRKEPF